ncbi:MAG: hypothetical protein ACJA06_002181 [Halocynthiibacter sp.]|jgi:hypothetical protein
MFVTPDPGQNPRELAQIPGKSRLSSIYLSRNARDMLSRMGFIRYCTKVRSSVRIMISAGMPGVGVKPGTRSSSSGAMEMRAT